MKKIGSMIQENDLDRKDDIQIEDSTLAGKTKD